MSRSAKTNLPKITVCYTRVTREESVKKELSLPNQRKGFHELAKRQKWDPTQVFQEQKGTSGELPVEDRPELLKMMQAARQGEIERVVCRHQDRLGRGDIVLPILKELRGLGIEVWTFGGPVDLKTAIGRLMARMEAAIGAFETERTGERIRDMKRWRAKEGIYLCPAPYGYTSQARCRRELIRGGMSDKEATAQAQETWPVTPRLYVDDDEAGVVREIYRRYVEGKEGTRQICNDLNSRGVTRRGMKWHPSQVVDILHDPKPAGWVTFDEEAYEEGRPSSAPVHRQTRYPAKHPAIISTDPYEKAQRLMALRRGQIDTGRADARVYALTGVLKCKNGHLMKGRSSRKGTSRWVYYTCSVRSRKGAVVDEGGCDSPPVRARAAEGAVAVLLSEFFTKPETVVRAWKAAMKKMKEESPEKVRALQQADMEIANVQRQRESVIEEFRAASSDGEVRAVADRVLEANSRIQALQERRSEIERMVLPIQVRQLSKKQVAGFLRELSDSLKAKPEAFRDLIQLLHVHHGLVVTAEDAHNLRIELHLDPISISGEDDDIANLPVKIPITLEGRAGQTRLSNEEWAAQENERGHACACGCGHNIRVRPDMRAKTVGIPKYILGHQPMPTAVHVQELNAEGYLSSTQAAKELGIGATTLRRAEDKGWITPKYKQWGNRHPMRIYKREDMPALKESMKKAGFRFPKDKSVITSSEMANALGISVSYLYYLERKGKVPPPPRDHAGKRMWCRRDIRKLKRILR